MTATQSTKPGRPEGVFSGGPAGIRPPKRAPTAARCRSPVQATPRIRPTAPRLRGHRPPRRPHRRLVRARWVPARGADRCSDGPRRAPRHAQGGPEAVHFVGPPKLAGDDRLGGHLGHLHGDHVLQGRGHVQVVVAIQEDELGVGRDLRGAVGGVAAQVPPLVPRGGARRARAGRGEGGEGDDGHELDVELQLRVLLDVTSMSGRRCPLDGFAPLDPPRRRRGQEDSQASVCAFAASPGAYRALPPRRVAPGPSKSLSSWGAQRGGRGEGESNDAVESLSGRANRPSGLVPSGLLGVHRSGGRRAR